ncbi:MAG: KEOPS complex subunit Pcc1 [Thermoplasmatota archaeon]
MLASIHIPCSEDEAFLLQQSIELEVADGPEGTTCALTIKDGLHVSVTGRELSNFRAAVNQVLRLVDTVERL